MTTAELGRKEELAAVDKKALRRDLQDFYEDYAVTLDECEIEDWVGYFTDDCLYRAISRENYDLDLPMASMSCDGVGMLRDRAMALRETTVFEPRSLRHLVGGVRIRELHADGTISAQANYAVFESMAHREPHLFSVGRYIDRIVRDGERFRFKEHLAVYDNYRIYTSLIWPL
jgi:anthranilate 1,2-dioxygenase small subunit